MRKRSMTFASAAGEEIAEHSIIFSDKGMKVRGNVSRTERSEQRVEGAIHPHHSLNHSMELNKYRKALSHRKNMF